MALKLALRSKPDPELSDYEIARDAAQEIERAVAAKRIEHEQRKMAINCAAAGTTVEGEILGKPGPVAVAKTTPELIREAVRYPNRAIDNLRAVEDELDRLRPLLFEARASWRRAQQKETNRIAATLKAKHAEAVKTIAAGLEAVSRGIAAEREIHEELRRLAPLRESHVLPNMIAGLGFGDLSADSSVASQWARMARREGYLL